MSLSEFLLAMFDADEARRWYVHDAECDVWAESSGLPLAQVFVDMTISARCDCPIPARILAECDAKRRIVEHCTDVLGEDIVGPCRSPMRAAAAYILFTLAQSSRDHPGYDADWRPYDEAKTFGPHAL
jgi:hypothetical protein